jgi:hypothetical protein
VYLLVDHEPNHTEKIRLAALGADKRTVKTAPKEVKADYACLANVFIPIVKPKVGSRKAS